MVLGVNRRTPFDRVSFCCYKCPLSRHCNYRALNTCNLPLRIHDPAVPEGRHRSLSRTAGSDSQLRAGPSPGLHGPPGAPPTCSSYGELLPWEERPQAGRHGRDLWRKRMPSKWGAECSGVCTGKGALSQSQGRGESRGCTEVVRWTWACTDAGVPSDRRLGLGVLKGKPYSSLGQLTESSQGCQVDSGSSV